MLATRGRVHPHFAWLLAVVVACDSGGGLYAEAEVHGEVVRVTAHVGTGTEVTASSQTRRGVDYEPVVIDIALERFQPGPNTLEVTSGEGSASVDFTVPEGAGAPFLQVHRCVAPQEAGFTYVEVRGPFGMIPHCRSRADGSLWIEATTNPSATLTVDGRELEVGGDGQVALPLDALGALLDRPLAAIASSDADDVEVAVPVLIHKEGYLDFAAPLQLLVNARLGLSDLLARVQPGEPVLGGAAPPDDAGRTAVYRRGDTTAEVHVVGAPGRLRDLDVVALGTTRVARGAGQCGPYVLPDGTEFSAPREEIDVEVAAYDARTGQELGRQAFSAAGVPCPGMAWMTGHRADAATVFPPQAAIDGWLLGLLGPG